MTDSKRTPLIENGIVVGTGSNKYQLKNHLARYLLKGFDNAVGRLAAQVEPSTILEVGCGEGHVTNVLLKSTNATVKATDISDTILAEAQSAVPSPRVSFERLNICASNFTYSPVDLVVCCEVLEHLHDPLLGLQGLASIDAPYCLISIPREPIWRILNFMRGAYLGQLGNSPGHLHHWSKKAFLAFVAQKFDILAIASPLPWTVVLGRSRAVPPSKSS